MDLQLLDDTLLDKILHRISDIASLITMLISIRHYETYRGPYPEAYHRQVEKHPNFFPEHSYYLLEISRPNLDIRRDERRTRVLALLTELTPTTNPALTLTRVLNNPCLLSIPYAIKTHESVAMVTTFHTLSLYAIFAMTTHYIDTRPSLLPPFETRQDAIIKQISIRRVFHRFLPDLLAGRMSPTFFFRKLVPDYIRRRGNVFVASNPYHVTWSIKRDIRVLIETFYRILYVLVAELDLRNAQCPIPCHDCKPNPCSREIDPEKAEAEDRCLYLCMWSEKLSIEQQRVLRDMCGIDPNECIATEGNWLAALWNRVFKYIPVELLKEEGCGYFVSMDKSGERDDGKSIIHVIPVPSTVGMKNDEDEYSEEDEYWDSEFNMSNGEDNPGQYGNDDRFLEMDPSVGEEESDSHAQDGSFQSARTVVMVDLREALSDEESDVFDYQESDEDEEKERNGECEEEGIQEGDDEGPGEVSDSSDEVNDGEDDDMEDGSKGVDSNYMNSEIMRWT